MKTGDTYHNICNDQPSTWTVTHIHDDGKVTVYSPQSQMSYTISRVIFEDTMRHLGFTLQQDEPLSRYHVYYIDARRYSNLSFDSINQAIEYGKETSTLEFHIKLGDMACCAWDPITGLRFFSEYQTWSRDQATRLSQVEGSYP